MIQHPIPDLQTIHKMVEVMRDNTFENKSQVIQDLFESKGVQNYFSTAMEPRDQRSIRLYSPELSWQSQDSVGILGNSVSVTQEALGYGTAIIKVGWYREYLVYPIYFCKRKYLLSSMARL
jgi:hypothetical protein